MAIANYAQRVTGQLRSRKPHKESLDSLTSLVAAYRTGRLVIALGSGVSKEYGVPDWDTLLYHLMLTASQEGNDFEADSATLTAMLLTSALHKSPTVAARYIQLQTQRKGSAVGLLFEEQIRSAIYKDLKWEGTPQPFHDELRQLALAPAASPQLNCIITYNYDDLIERALKSIPGVEIPHMAIHGPKMRAIPPELPIYHVHGYLPQAGSLGELNRVILAEADYHRQYANAFQWQNQVQLEKFSDCTCLFFGLSFSDPNLRRLLDIAHERHNDGDLRHFIVRRRPRVDEAVTALVREMDTNPELQQVKHQVDMSMQEVAEHLLDLQMEFEQTDAESFGVGTIWVGEHSGNADVLKAVRKQNPVFAADAMKPVRPTSGAA